MDSTDALLTWARDRWPEAFTKREAALALGLPLRRLDRIKGLMDTGARQYYRNHRGELRPVILWRYRPYQMRLPLGDE